METLPYIDLEVTPGVETHSVDSEGISQAVNVQFPFGTSLEPRIYVGNNFKINMILAWVDQSWNARSIAPFLSDCV